MRGLEGWLIGVVAAAITVVGCSQSDGEVDLPEGDGVFESAHPGAPSRGDQNAGAGTGGTSGAPTDGDEGGDPSRAIEEADIIKVQGDRLYALSQYGGLSVIDVGERDQLRLLGRHKVSATPFEMYVREGIVFALYRGYGESRYDEATGTYTWSQTSHVVILDARDPSSIRPLGKFPIPGEISDSRIVGDVLYAAAYEDGYCWGCDATPRTTVISLDVSDPTSIRAVDELSFEERSEGYSWRRSLSATDQRLYIAGPTWGISEPVGSTIQVIDISDPSGDMQLGAEVQVAGQIQSRWQMDEYEGVLRVVSQPFDWSLNAPPSVQTYSIVSSRELVPLGSLEMTLPRPEQLQSVRFDGVRAYAITFERTDPLFTLDLSVPAAPRQAGELEMPGWVYHMEPRGDRLLGLGFDQGNPAGALTVSLFDVSDLEAPTMIDRVNFGGDWAYLAEDQDRIHKSFNVIDSAGLILVPFSGWTQDDQTGCYGAYTSGVQLVDWAEDTLRLRGVAPAVGQARRGFLHDERLFTVSDERVQTFDLADRDAPQPKAELALAQFVMRTVGTSHGVVRIGQNWWTGTTELDVTPLASAEEPMTTAKLSIPQLGSKYACYSGEWLGDVYSNGSLVYLVYQSWDHDPDTGKSSQRSRVITVDVSTADAPAVVGDAELGFAPSYSYGYVEGLADTGAGIVAVGSTLVFADRRLEYDGQGSFEITASSLKVVDLSVPQAPVVTEVALPRGLGATGLLASGNVVGTSHFERSPLDPARVRFYLDRVDVSDPRNPVVLPSINVPGSLVALDAESSRAAMVDYRDVVFEAANVDECREHGWYAVFEPSDPNDGSKPGTCRTVQQTVQLVRLEGDRAFSLGGVELADEERVSSTAVGDNRLFVTVTPSSGYWYAYDCYGPGCGWTRGDQPASLLALAGLHSGAFASGRLELQASDYYSSAIVASGQRAAFTTGYSKQVSIVDAGDVTEPRVVRQVDLEAGYATDLEVVDGSLVASMYYDGVQVIPLAD